MNNNKKLLLDENIIGYKEFLVLLDHDVSSIDDHGLRGRGDDVIVKFAKANDFFIITKDKKMDDKCKIHGVPCFLISDSWIAKKVNEELLMKNQH